MLNLKDFQIARKNIAEKRDSNAESIFDEALKILESYKNLPSITKLEQLGKKLIETISYNKEHLPAYLYLSFVFYALNNEEMALKYIKIAESLSKDPLPSAILKYKDEINNKIEQKFSRNLGGRI
ncbi:MAG: hypothetical protein U0457_20090 [Candidatus Sericytochromatia bacterium]